MSRASRSAISFSAPTLGSRNPGKPKKKRKVKPIVIAPVESSDESEVEVIAPAEEPRAKSVSPAPAVLDKESVEADMTDPRNLPQSKRRRREGMQRLEIGVYRSALHDVIQDEFDLSKVLYTWEKMRMEKVIETEEESEEEDLEFTFPPLNSQALKKAVRWPIAPASLPPEQFTLGEELSALVTTNKKNLKIPSTTQEIKGGIERTRKRARSAYSVDGAFEEVEVSETRNSKNQKSKAANSVHSDSPPASPLNNQESNSDESEDELDSSELEELDSNKMKVVARVATTLDSLLLNLAKQAPPCYFPPTDLWEARKLNDSWRSKISESSLDHLDVLKALEGMGKIPKEVVEQLRAQLGKIYGSIGEISFTFAVDWTRF